MTKLFEFDEHIGDWRVLVQSRDIQNGAIQSRHITNDAVTTAKIGNGEVKTRNIDTGAVTTVKIGDGEVKTRNIDTGAVTTVKIGDKAVTTVKIDDKAVTTAKIQDHAVTTEKIDDEAITSPKIAPKAVTRDKLAPEAVPELLALMDEFVASVREQTDNYKPVTIRGNVNNAADEEDLTAVDGLLKLKDRSGLYGYGMKILRKGKAFASQVTQTRCIYVVQYDFDLGGAFVTMQADSIILFSGGRITNGTLIGSKTQGLSEGAAGTFGLMLCSALYYDYGNYTLQGDCTDETSRSLQTQINEIVSGGAKVSLIALPSVVFANTPNQIELRAVSDKETSHIAITKRGATEPIAEGEFSPVDAQITINQDAGSIYFDAEFTISGLHRAAQCLVNIVYPIYFGSGMAQSDVLDVAACKASARTSPTATYTIEIAGSAKYIWFFVPANMSTQITRAKMNGFDFPLETLADVTDASNVTYKVYRTPNTNEVGTYVISINPSN